MDVWLVYNVVALDVVVGHGNSLTQGISVITVEVIIVSFVGAVSSVVALCVMVVDDNVEVEVVS